MVGWRTFKTKSLIYPKPCSTLSPLSINYNFNLVVAQTKTYFQLYLTLLSLNPHRYFSNKTFDSNLKYVQKPTTSHNLHYHHPAPNTITSHLASSISLLFDLLPSTFVLLSLFTSLQSQISF